MATKAPASIAFDTVVRRIGDRTIVPLPAEASAALPSRGQVAATGTVDGHEFRTVVEPDGRKGHWLRIDGPLEEIRAGAGDPVALELTPTKEWPEPEVPDDLAAALDGAPDIADVWSGITSMARWEWVRWIGATKNPATRAKRVDVAVDKMRSGKRRPCCFDLSSCTDPEISTSGKLIEAD
ncbi:YdeI/OmpD-associated family protein [Tsukamurella sp. 1534]|uniref:YdeI/OmpD-associated family protein n=1 Tax=Tsukamurella sp. 1534 TaxID=1151061 RepID=UPI000307A11D|nr:YdeI/OmpD-associated family protein [Tsukamurella sp. 1534]